MFLVEARITGKREVGRGMWVIAMVAPEIATTVRSGEFVNLGWAPGPLLRRPFSVYRAGGDDIEVVLKEVGAGTAQLLKMRQGDPISCLGPLGKGFSLVPSGSDQSAPPARARRAGLGSDQSAQPTRARRAGAQRSVALVSGGLGVAPMPLAAKEARAFGMTVTWVHGARTESDLCSEADGDEVIWATDDGSLGFAGNAVAAAPDADLVLVCGPNRMLAAAAARWPEAQVAVETYMGCGTGVCLGCAVPLARGGYDRACREGPVYRASEVDWAALPSHLPYAIDPLAPLGRGSVGGA